MDLATPVARGVGRSAAAEGVVCQSLRNIIRFLLQEFYPLLSQDETELHNAGMTKDLDFQRRDSQNVSNKSKFYYQLMHKRIALKGVLKFTLQ
jgi:hypothetical protein